MDRSGGLFLDFTFDCFSLKFHGRSLQRHSFALQRAAFANLLVLLALLRQIRARREVLLECHCAYLTGLTFAGEAKHYVSYHTYRGGAMRKENLLLASLPEAERERLSPYLKKVVLEFQQVLIEPNQEITDIYFPYDAITSTIQEMSDGASVETG